ncbi:glycoside hydrolase family 3 protein [Pseudalkalibacillus sp. A8]|uniref:glycoside hydrolase family 3 protein n=1 Tax=Pseudalkalibacillus sp. A8 TaxID=3382641 RepID=UPI0038B55896
MQRSLRWTLILMTTILLVIILKIALFPNAEITKWEDVDSVEDIDGFIDKMTTEEKVGQLLMPAIRDFDNAPVTEMNEELEDLLDTYQPGGIILFHENVRSRTQVKQLNEDLQVKSEIPLIMSIDQEGGLVTRLSYFPELSGNMALGATRNPDLAKETGRVLGTELKQLGIHIDFAPSIDINTNPYNPVIGVRSYGDDPSLVGEMGISFMNGLQEAGVMAVAKHFPGHGGLDMDSHYVLPVSEQSLDELKRTELSPFQKMIDEGVSGMMTAHITFPNIDQSEFISQKDGLPIKVPATLSPKIMKLLREEMNFDGLVFTDSMEMKAIADHFGPGEAAVQAVLAGVDVIVMPGHLKVAYDALIEAVKEGRITAERLDKSAQRILQAKVKWVEEEINAPNSSITQKAMDLEKKVAEQSITLLENAGNTIPLSSSPNDPITIISSDAGNLEAMKNALWNHHKKFHLIQLKSGSLTSDQKQKIEDGAVTIMVTESATVLGDGHSDWEKTGLQEAVDHSEQSILIMARNPYDAAVLADVDAAIAQYSDNHTSFKMTGDVIFGEKVAVGELPVQLQNLR